MSVSEIEKAVRKLTGLKPAKDEKRSDYLTRLAEALDKEDAFTEEEWNALPDPVQNWINDACTALGENKDVKDFPEEDDEDKKPKATKKSAKAAEEEAEEDDDDEESETSESEEPEEEESKVSTKETGAAKKKAAAPAKKAKAEKTEKPKAAAKEAKPKKGPKPKKAKPEKGDSKSAILKRMLLDNPDLTAAQCDEKLKKKNVDMGRSTLVTIRSGFLHSLKVVEDAGRLKAKGE